VHLGPLGLGNTMKLVNSLVAFTTTWVSLEGLSLAAKSGIPWRAPSRCCAPTASPTSTSTAWSRTSTPRNGPTQFALALAAKDAGLIVETGRALGVPTPAGAAVMQVLVGAVAAGLGDHDWADLVAAAERQGNVELRLELPLALGGAEDRRRPTRSAETAAGTPRTRRPA
jgi:4-hydroxybutyrate dehydrogenase/sulfolactaldehyde 3-reductase